MKGKIELLAPAGSKDAFNAAINNGADAIYLSGNNYGARAYADNFTTDEIIYLIKTAHLLNVKVYVTVNTLIKDKEIEDCLSYVKRLYENNVDAILVQDIGFASLCREVFPNLALHASTQMNIHNKEEAKILKDLGFKRIVLSRECSLIEIKDIIDNVDIEIEVFGHGANCMSYSGNCLMSSFIGGRSGNRGRCAGACRQKYRLIKDGKVLSDDNYYLSLKDLKTYNRIDELIKAGISSIKLEGRMKRSEYVALITNIYRSAIDKKLSNTKLIDYEIDEMFNRGYTKGFLFGESNNEMTNIKSPNHMGVSLGKVIKSKNNYVIINTNLLAPFDSIKLGDSIRIYDKNKEDGIILSNVDVYDKNMIFNHKMKSDELIKNNSFIGFKTHIDLDKDMDVVKTSSIDLMNRNKDNDHITKKIGISGLIFSKDNHLALELKYVDDEINVKVCGESEEELEEAKSDYLERIKAQVNKINDTYFYFEKIDIRMNNAYLKVSAINELRRRLIDELEKEIIKARALHLHKDIIINKPKFEKMDILNTNNIYVRINNKAQYDACKDLNVKYILTDNELLKDLDGIYYMNDRLSSNKGIQEELAISSPYLNVMNAFTCHYYHDLGIKIVGISPEMERSEIKDLIKYYNKYYKSNPNLLILVYGYIESMIMKHCLINKYYNYDNKNCMQCINNQYYLRDKMNLDFPLIRGNNCNLKLLNSFRLNLIKYIDEIKNMGINNFLLDFTIEDYDATYEIINAYRCAINGLDYKLDIDNCTYGHYLKGIE